ncbi:MAG TPA: YibE/F family protein [Solirubrobacteraceae bacterium]|jgi:uncharacterized membrane protein|nr:YibE/F family protein [Solirubrobacteraceae bacterium]
MSSADLDLIDPDEYFAEHDRRARARRERRSNGKRKRLGTPARFGEAGSLPGTTGGRALIGAVVILALLTLLGLALLWPGAASHTASRGFTNTVRASVKKSYIAPCASGSGVRCRELSIAVKGESATVDLGPVATTPSLGAGTPIRVSPVSAAPGSVPSAHQQWEFVNVDRTGSLLWLAVALLLLSLVVIRVRGLLAAIGVGLSLLLLVKFLVPAILAGEPALLVALVCALAVMFITLVLTSGFGPQTLAAALGIGSTLLLTSLLALLAIHVAHLDGRTDELSNYLATVNPHISLQGIVLAGMVIGALGVLADTAVTQASAVMALRRTDPDLGPRALYKAAFHVGRDHLSATIHTLVLAYAGAALPLLLITHYSGVGLTDALSTQDIAEPVFATLVGCIGLVCAVPVTTGLAAVLVARVPPRAFKGVHSHAH